MSEKEIMETISVRVPSSMLDRIDQQASRLEKQLPGSYFPITRVIRMVMASGLTAMEDDDADGK